MHDVSSFLLLLKSLPRDWRAVIDRRLAPLGLSQAKWQPLLYLLRTESPPTQAEIARHLDIESPTLVRLLDRLENDGWIERKACPGDRRARRIHLTAHASRQSAAIQDIVSGIRQQLVKGVRKSELAQCTAVLRKVQKNTADLLEALAANPEPAGSGRQKSAKAGR